MEKRRFGRTDLHITPLGYGGAEIGLLDLDTQAVTDLLNAVLDAGINVIDTAAMYQSSETLIGNAIASRREAFVLISKCGTAVDEIDSPAWSAELIRRSVDRSLKSLKTDHLDVMLLHSCDLDTLRKGEALGALIEARDAGKVRFVGYSGDNEAAAHAATLADVAVIQTSISIADQVNIDSVLPTCREHDVGVMAKRPIANAAWKDLDQQPGFYSTYAAEYTRRLKEMDVSPAELGFDGDDRSAWAELALRFTLSQPGVHTAIIGTTKSKNLHANIAAARKGPLPDDVIARIREAFRAAAAKDSEPWRGQT